MRIVVNSKGPSKLKKLKLSFLREILAKSEAVCHGGLQVSVNHARKLNFPGFYFWKSYFARYENASTIW